MFVCSIFDDYFFPSSSSSSSSVIVGSANILLILYVVGYNQFTVFGSRLVLSIYPILIPLLLTVILSIVVIVAAVSRYLVGTSPSSFF